MFSNLNSENFTYYAMKNYQNVQCYDISEFYEDLKRFKYLKKLINRYLNGDNRDNVFRLILNHIITIYNCFGITASSKMIKFKFDQSHLSVIKPCLIFLQYIKLDDFEDTPINKNAEEACRKINDDRL